MPTRVVALGDVEVDVADFRDDVELSAEAGDVGTQLSRLTASPFSIWLIRYDHRARPRRDREATR